MHIPLAKPEILESDIAAVAAVMRSCRLSQGAALRALEEALASYLHVGHAVAVNSGTSALQLALRALQIQEGDEIILPSFSFMAVTNAVLAARAVPVFADIDPGSLNLDAAQVEPLLSARTKAIIVVHTFGYPAPVEQIIGIARRHRLFVIEDACEALGAEVGAEVGAEIGAEVGAEVNGRKAGTLGDVGIFAFYPNKQITTGEGGALVTNSPALAERVRSLSNQGRQPSSDWFQHAEAGFSYRLSDMNCALGIEQLSRIEKILSKREELARRYQQHLENNSGVKCYCECANGRISWFTYPVLLPAHVRQWDRDEIWKALNRLGIESGRYFPPAHLQPVMRKFPSRCGDLSQTVELSQRLLCLPFFNSLQDGEIEFVCQALSTILAERTTNLALSS
jgi:perosamine synthetase